MAKFKRTDEYDSNIHALLRFLSRTGESGYTFSIAQHEGLIPAINSELVEMSRKRSKKVQIVAYEDPEDNDITFAEQLRRAAPDADALIVTGIDQPLRERPYFIDALNFSREAFHEIGKPILFWLTQESLAFIGNRAVDFYTQRSMMTVQFENTPEINAPAPELERRFRDETYRSKEDYEALKTRVNLLKKQLNEALEAEIPRRRIAQDIALPLSKTYSELDLHKEALGLLEQFFGAWDESDARQLYERGVILAGGSRQKEAIDCLGKAQGLLENGGDLALLADVHMRAGDISNNATSVLEHYEANLTLKEKLLTETPLDGIRKKEVGVAFRRLGIFHTWQNNLNKALEFYGKAAIILEEVYENSVFIKEIKEELGRTYNNMGATLESQGKLEKALSFFEKDLKLTEDVYSTSLLSQSAKRDLAVSYQRIGGILKKQWKLKEALEFFERALKILDVIRLENPLSEDLKFGSYVSYNGIAFIHERLGNWPKAIYYSRKETNEVWHLCRFVGWHRHKAAFFLSSLNLVFTVILPPPISTVLLWISDRIDLFYKRLRYGSEKPTPPPTS